jgi:hypothetical protein
VTTDRVVNECRLEGGPDARASLGGEGAYPTPSLAAAREQQEARKLSTNAQRRPARASEHEQHEAGA